MFFTICCIWALCSLAWQSFVFRLSLSLQQTELMKRVWSWSRSIAVIRTACVRESQKTICSADCSFQLENHWWVWGVASLIFMLNPDFINISFDEWMKGPNLHPIHGWGRLHQWCTRSMDYRFDRLICAFHPWVGISMVRVRHSQSFCGGHGLCWACFLGIVHRGA